MLVLLNFNNYELDYAIEYPESIDQDKMRVDYKLGEDFKNWVFHSDFQSLYIVLAKVFNALYDISRLIEQTFNPNWYIDHNSDFSLTDKNRKELDEAHKCLHEGFGFLNSNYSDEDYTRLENEMTESLNFLRQLMNGLSSIVSFLQKRDTRTALLLLRSLFSLDLRFYLSDAKKPKISELIDTYSNEKSYLSEHLLGVLFEQNSYEHIFQARGFGFSVNENKIGFDFRHDHGKREINFEKPEKGTVIVPNVDGFGSWIHELMAKYHHHAFPTALIPGMRRRHNDFSVLNSVLSITSLELLFIAIEKIEGSFQIKRVEDGVPLSQVLYYIMKEGNSQKKFPEHLFHNRIGRLRYNLWEFFIFTDQIKSHYVNLVENFVSHLKEESDYGNVINMLYLS